MNIEHQFLTRIDREYGDPRVIVRILDEKGTAPGGITYVLRKGGDLFELDHIVVSNDGNGEVFVRIAGRKVRKSDYARYDRVSYLQVIDGPMETVAVLPGEQA